MLAPANYQNGHVLKEILKNIVFVVIMDKFDSGSEVSIVEEGYTFIS
ncbi:MAG: hypothetical protein NWS46_02805 [Cyclobacteriaceae bacterium]|jgi:hypothetical protein|nr:hypothetical protein [Cyclobacteriaceae bacterium]